MNDYDTDPTEYLESLDRFLENPEEEGQIPLQLIAERGVDMPSSTGLEDDEIHEILWKAIHAMADLGMYLTSTDHLGDRDLYDLLRNDLLREPTMLLPDNPSFGCYLDPVSGGSDEDIENYLRYYADEKMRKRWLRDFPGTALPPSETPPHDRDRLLPRQEDRLPGQTQ